MATELMRWCNDRWLKKITAENVPEEYRRQYRPSPRSLAKRYPDLVTDLTRDGSRRAANQYWHDLQAEIRAATVPPTIDGIIDDLQANPKQPRRRIRAKFGQLAEIMMEKLAPARRQLEDMGLIGDWPKTEAQAAIIESVQDAALRDELPKLQVKHESTVGYWRDRFLAKRKTELEVMSYNQLTYHLKVFVPFLGEKTDIKTVDESKVEAFKLHLADRVSGKDIDSKKITAIYAVNVCTTVKSFLKYLYELRAIELPRNIDSLKFDKPHREPAPILLEDARKIIKQSTGELRAWILTMFNVAGYQSDLSELDPKEVDWKAGRIIRKRSKEKHEKNVPTVDHLMWRETFKAIKAHGNQTGERVFLVDGKPLVVARNDKVAPAWDKHLTALGMAGKYNLRQIRKTVATILGNRAEFKPYVDFYGGWSRGSMVDSAYFKIARENMDAMTKYLGEELGVK